MIHNWSEDESRIKDGVKVKEDFVYSSDNNNDWMSVSDLAQWIDSHRNKIGNF